MAKKKRVPSLESDSEQRSRAFNDILALRGILEGTDAEEFLAETRRIDEELMEAKASGEYYDRFE